MTRQEAEQLTRSVSQEWGTGTHSPQPTFGSEPPRQGNEPAQQLGSIGWAIFLIWIGIAMLGHFPWGWFLLGTGMLILAVQFGRWRIGVEVENFWVACGTVFVVGGVWQLLDLPWPLAPLLLILLGVISLGKAIRRAKG